MIKLAIENGVESFNELENILCDYKNMNEDKHACNENKVRNLDPNVVVALIEAGGRILESIITNITSYVIAKKKAKAEEEMKPTPIILIQININNEIYIEKSNENLIDLKGELEIIDTVIVEKDNIDIGIKFH